MARGRMYACCFENVVVTAAQDFFDIAPADDKPVVLHGCWLSQSTEVGDAQEEFLRIKIIRGFATVGSGVGTFTPVPLNSIDAAAGFTCRINDTTPAVVGGGTTDLLWAESFNERSGWIWLPTPDMQPICTQVQTRIVVTMLSTPADSVTMNGTLVVEEI
jgi:hypothetical protein